MVDAYSALKNQKMQTTKNNAEWKGIVATKSVNSLAEFGTAELKKSGIFTVPRLARIKTRQKPTTKAAKKIFGKWV